jgi:hypothetical protein
MSAEKTLDSVTVASETFDQDGEGHPVKLGTP